MKKLTISIVLVMLLICHPLLAHHPAGTVNVDVNGLVCDFCARALEKVFARQDQVESIVVNLDEKIVTIHFHPGKHLDDATLTERINDAGYSVEAIHHGS